MQYVLDLPPTKYELPLRQPPKKESKGKPPKLPTSKKERR